MGREREERLWGNGESLWGRRERKNVLCRDVTRKRERREDERLCGEK